MKKIVGAAVAVATLVGLAGPAAAASGTERFSLLFGVKGNGSVTASGPITASGTLVTIDDSHDKFVFKHGTITVLHVSTGSSDNFNDKTCVDRSTDRGTFTISAATGAYAGASGSGTYRGSGTFTGVKTATGCSENPVGGAFVVNAKGTVSV